MQDGENNRVKANRETHQAPRRFVSDATDSDSSFVEDENENEIMTWHALGHWDENIGAKIES